VSAVASDARRSPGDTTGATVGRYLLLAVAAGVTLYPVLLIVSTALKEPLDVAVNPFGLFSSFSLENFSTAWDAGGFGDYFLNTVYVTVPTVILVVALSSLAGYGLAQYRFRGRSLVFYLFMVGLMVPFFSVMIPLFYELRDLELLGSYAAVILPATAGATGFGLPLGVFLMRAFYQRLPRELADAARVDGAGELAVFMRIMLPLSMPGVAVLAVLVFFSTWNTFVLPLLYLTDPEKQMLATGLYLAVGSRTLETGVLAAGSLIMVVPVLAVFVAFQRQFVRGITAGALKG
jgi:ABC-type glycerol-3-phosphate transport system permease component